MTWFHKYFVPHEGNEYKPHLLRNEIAFGLLALILIFEVAFLAQVVFFGRGAGLMALVLPNTLVDQTNQERISANLPPLAENPLLTAAAQQKANDMAAKGYFAHTSPEGITPWHWFKQVGYNYTHAGENLAVNFSDSIDVTSAWMNSPAHRENILNGSFTQIGIATARGSYQGARTVFVVQLFGKPPAPKPAAPVVAVAPAPAPAPAPASTPAPIPAPAPAPVSSRPATVTQPLPDVPPQQNSVIVEGTATESAPTTTDAEPGAEPETPLEVSEGAASSAAPIAGSTEDGTRPKSNIVQRIFAAPRFTANVVYVALALMVVLALLLNVFVKMGVQHPQLVLNGLMILLVIGTLAVFNQRLLLANAQVF